MSIFKNCFVFCFFAVNFLLSQHAFGETENLQFLEDGVSGIKLHSPKSIQKTLGDSAWKQVKSSKLPGGTASFLSKDEKQRLTLVFHPGGVKNSFSEMFVELTSGDKKFNATEQTEFRASKGVQLGISEKKLQERLGRPSKKVNGPTEIVLNYFLVDPNHPFLKKHNMPSYYGKYTFRDNKLVKFAFGFEYP